MDARRVLNKVAAWLLLVCLIVVPSVARLRQWQVQRSFDKGDVELNVAVNDPAQLAVIVSPLSDSEVPTSLKVLPSNELSTLGAPETCDIDQRLSSGFIVEGFTAPGLLVVGSTLVAHTEGALCGFQNGSLKWKLGSSIDQEYIGRDGSDVITTWDGSPSYARVIASSGLVVELTNTPPTGQSEQTHLELAAAGRTFRIKHDEAAGFSTAEFRSVCELVDTTFFADVEIATIGNWMYLTSTDHELLLGFDATKPNRAKVFTQAFGSDDVRVTNRC